MLCYTCQLLNGVTMPFKDPVKRAEKQKEYRKRHYEKNRAAQIARVRRYSEAYKKAFYEFKATLSCVKCGENHPAALDFHHHTPHPSNVKINALLQNKQYTKALQEIQEKCIVLCANCHRIHHWEEHNLRKAQKAMG